MYRATGREQCQAPRSGLCALESEVPRGFGEEAESLHCHDPGELKAFFGSWSQAAGTLHLLSLQPGRNVAPPPCPYLCSCFPAAPVTTMPFSICFVSFPGPLMPATPGRRQRRGIVVSRANAKTKDKENLSLGGDGRTPGL